MILVNYTRLEGALPAAAVRALLDQLPKPKADAMARLKNPRQSTASMLGLLLLKQALEQLGGVDFRFDQLKFSPGEKPLSTQGIEFNITHSETIVACAVSRNIALGIDSETISKQPVTRLHHIFNESELAMISNDNEKFLELWVKKEAVAKASGDGVRAMKAIDLDQQRAKYKDQQWYLHRLALDAQDVSYLASQQSQPDIHLQYHTFSDCVACCNAASVLEQRYG